MLLLFKKLNFFGETKVDNFWNISFEYNVSGFDVSVDNLIFKRKIYTYIHLMQVIQGTD